MYKKLPYYLQYDYLLLLNIQIFLTRQKTVHKISSFVPQFLQKKKKNKLEGSPKAGHRLALGHTNKKEVKYNPKQPSWKKRARPSKRL